jgi:hypothetical protein
MKRNLFKSAEIAYQFEIRETENMESCYSTFLRKPTRVVCYCATVRYFHKSHDKREYEPIRKNNYLPF